MANSEIDRNSGNSQPTIVRTTSSTVLFFVIASLCVIGVGSIVVGDFTSRGLAVAGIPIAIITIVYALYRFPRVELGHKELALINPLLSVRIPWNLVDGFDIHFGLGVRTHEKVYSSWPLASKGKKMEKDEHGIRRLMDNPNPAVDTVLDRYSGLGDEELSNPRGQRTITTRWNLGIITALVIAVVWAAFGFAALPS
ncbi:MAG: hypothetical protein L0J17_11505 [Brevibacterium sp.]|uniref:hypothetical protein n=1 Tax=Brevibacterium sp. TaxID=1701 RepID=UPI0026482573|nr:hypothetical protein [Brevibacterium sp.]MDN5808218.1 hypothetical protein [Brevibacterium sp.]MDN5834693.1 hypothetical protein [Brevibacterium sp.]MDN5877512.1 hypothetical protein [Brevibacterium sp.]MDN5910524.1 hypothetical protein [Brevibacterium sp.]MDN6134420.1 hypothetical protein [Brevibacterium sp.]